MEITRYQNLYMPPLINFTALNNLIKRLDNRIQSNDIGMKRSGFVRFERKVSDSSTSEPPNKAPLWAISTCTLMSASIMSEIFLCRYNN